MASLVKQGQVWYVKYYDAEGKQKWVKGFSQKGPTQDLAIKLEHEKSQLQTGMIDPQQVQQQAERRKDISHHLTQYESHLAAGGRSKNHRAYTMADIRAFVDFAEPQTLSTITRSQIDSWVLRLVAQDEAYRAWLASGSDGPKQGTPNSARTINRRVGSIQAILKWAHHSGAVGNYVLAKYPKREVRGNAVRESRALDAAEIKKLLGWAKRAAPDRHNLYKFALLSGCRAEECAAMTPANFSGKTVTVHSKDPRHSDRVDTVPLHPDLIKLVAKLAKGKETSDNLFKLPDKQAERLRADCAAAGIDNTANITFHGLRHTFITQLARANIHPTVCQKLARHRDIAMTLTYYTHWSTTDEVAALAKI